MADMAVHGESGVASATASIYMLLFPVPVVCFLGALATDVRYWATAYLMWLHFSEWLIAAGLAVGALAALALLVEFISSGVIRTRLGWWHLVLFYVALIVELFNALVHTVDGWTAVVPNGIILSIVGSVLALAAAASWFRVPVPATTRWEGRP